MSSDPIDNELLALHQRLLAGDRTVSSELVLLLLAHLQQRLAYLQASVDDPDEVTSQIGLGDLTSARRPAAQGREAAQGPVAEAIGAAP